MAPLFSDIATRPLTSRNKAGAWLAMLTCPCHGVAVLYLGLGTAWGATLFAHREWLFGALGLAFAAGLWLLFRRGASACPLPATEATERGCD